MVNWQCNMFELTRKYISALIMLSVTEQLAAEQPVKNRRWASSGVSHIQQQWFNEHKHVSLISFFTNTFLHVMPLSQFWNCKSLFFSNAGVSSMLSHLGYVELLCCFFAERGSNLSREHLESEKRVLFCHISKRLNILMCITHILVLILSALWWLPDIAFT